MKILHLLVSFLASVTFSPEARGKSVTGVFKSEAARQQEGQFITRFMFRGKNRSRTCITLVSCLFLCVYFNARILNVATCPVYQ